MELIEEHIDNIIALSHSHIHNYVIPGLTSSLIGAAGPKGIVRLFQCSRHHEEVITPHSHRFDFTCVVLRGKVTNLTWEQCADGDTYQSSRLEYSGEIGKHIKTLGPIESWDFTSKEYREGSSYSMKANEVHSIKFSKGAVVLFFEGPDVANYSICIEPVVNGNLIETMITQPWMFLKD